MFEKFIFPPGLIVNGLINVSISTIERRFGLRSRQMGLVASGYDLASFACLVPVTYYGGRRGASKPRFIAIGLIVMGMGSLVFLLPNFLVGNYRATIAEANVCETTGLPFNSNSSQSMVSRHLPWRPAAINSYILADRLRTERNGGGAERESDLDGVALPGRPIAPRCRSIAPLYAGRHIYRWERLKEDVICLLG